MIIIETPAPPTRERLVLVPADAVSRTASEPALNVHTSAGRDATPADLERGGYVTGEMLAEHVRIVWAAGQEAEPVGVAMLRRLKDRAEKAERVAAMAKDIDGHTMADLRDDLRNASARYDEVWAALGTTSALANDTAPNIILAMRGDIIGLNADTERLLARAEKAEGLLIQRETELRLAREDGDERARDLRQAYERAVAAAEKAERERDDAVAAHRSALAEQTARADTNFRAALKVQGDMTELRAALAHAQAERDTLRAELARLTAPGAATEAQYREQSDFDAGVAHERARQQPAKDRATDEARPLREVSAEMEAMRTTHDERERVYVGAIASDEELVTVYRRAAEPLGDEHGVSLRDLVRRCQARGVLAVAARVRQERCLVAQAVARNADFHVTECMGGRWRVVVTDRDVNSKTELCAPAEVPATLARLLGEVGRG